MSLYMQSSLKCSWNIMILAKDLAKIIVCCDFHFFIFPLFYSFFILFYTLFYTFLHHFFIPLLNFFILCTPLCLLQDSQENSCFSYHTRKRQSSQNHPHTVLLFLKFERKHQADILEFPQCPRTHFIFFVSSIFVYCNTFPVQKTL